MRVSTSTIYNEGIGRLSTIQNQQIKLQEQIATGKKFNSPADDPIGAARALEMEYSIKVNDSYASTRIAAKNSLNLLEGNLASVTNLITNAQSILIGAGNASLSDLERGFKAQELQNTFDAILGLANSQDASGKFIFSGFNTDTQPFVESTTGATYNGGTNEIELLVDSKRQMAVNSTGNDVFQPTGGTDIFASLKEIITLLKTPITNDTERSAYNTGLTKAIGDMKGALNNVLNERARIGSQLSELDELDVAGDAMDLQYKTSLSQIQDLDYAEALSEVAKFKVIMEAAQQTFASTTKLSLFNFM
jgi:flagellar hook-associated protein 3 FlgL